MAAFLGVGTIEARRGKSVTSLARVSKRLAVGRNQLDVQHAAGPAARGSRRRPSNMVAKTRTSPTVRRRPSRNVPLARPVAVRETADGSAPTVLCSTDACPLYVRGQRNMTVYSATR